MDVEKLAKRYRVTDGKGFRLADHDPADTGGLDLGKKRGAGAAAGGASSGSPSCRTSSTPRTAGRCC